MTITQVYRALLSVINAWCNVTLHLSTGCENLAIAFEETTGQVLDDSRLNRLANAEASRLALLAS
jgi:hypothetical protein